MSGGPTVVDENARKRDGAIVGLVALLLVAVVSPFLREGPVDGETTAATAVLGLIALGAIAIGIHQRRNPRSLVVGDDEIFVEPSNDPTRRIVRTTGELRLHTVGSFRYRELVLSSTDDGTRLPLRNFDATAVADACHDHGWTFGD